MVVLQVLSAGPLGTRGCGERGEGTGGEADAGCLLHGRMITLCGSQ